jgi:hypothetical protein
MHACMQYNTAVVRLTVPNKKLLMEQVGGVCMYIRPLLVHPTSTI